MEGSLFLNASTFFGYFAVLLLVAFFSTRRQTSDTDFVIGNRSLNFWLTALSAHASDMSSWLFLAYPALIFTTGFMSAWTAIGLVVGMFLNWQFVAPKIRAETERFNSLTLNSYFEARFGDTTGAIRIVSATMSIFFFTVYISSGLVALGLLVESLFQFNYLIGISVGLAVVVIYVFAGGYRTVAYIDLVQGFFLLAVLVCIPAYLLVHVGGFGPVMQALKDKDLTTSLLPDLSGATFWQIIAGSLGWGLGYFGEPHIITKFMGIRHISEMYKAKWVGITWQVVALTAATVVGLLGVFFFPQGLGDSERVILEIVKVTLAPAFAGLVLCAVLAATTNVMAAQILVVASNLSEDFYKRMTNRAPSHHRLLFVSRLSVVAVAIVAFIIAFFKVATIYKLVLYAWSGIGASFGPLVLLSLYSKHVNKYGAFAGILVGGITGIIWNTIDSAYLHWNLPAMIAGFALGTSAILGVSYFTKKPRRQHD